MVFQSFLRKLLLLLCNRGLTLGSLFLAHIALFRKVRISLCVGRDLLFSLQVVVHVSRLPQHIASQDSIQWFRGWPRVARIP